MISPIWQLEKLVREELTGSDIALFVSRAKELENINLSGRSIMVKLQLVQSFTIWTEIN